MMFICARCSREMRGAIHAVAAHMVQHASVSARKAAIFCSCTAAVALRPANNLHAHHGLDSQGQRRRSYNLQPTPFGNASAATDSVVYSPFQVARAYSFSASSFNLETYHDKTLCT